MPEQASPRAAEIQLLYKALVAAIARRGMSGKTRRVYLAWVRRYIEFHGGRHPLQLDAQAVVRFLSYLANDVSLSPASQSQALAALRFFYVQVLPGATVEIEWLVRERQPVRMPMVMAVDDVLAVLAELDGTPLLIAMLLYGSGMRLDECLSLRVNDIDFCGNTLFVRGATSARDRLTLLPRAAKRALGAQLEQAKQIHQQDLYVPSSGWVELPKAQAATFPHAARDWIWQWVFPATRQLRHSPTQQLRRPHIHESVIVRALSDAVARAGLDRAISCHTFRHTFATQMLMNGCDIRTLQRLLGHKDIRTTNVYAQLVRRLTGAPRSPLDIVLEAHHKPAADHSLPRTPQRSRRDSAPVTLPSEPLPASS